MAWEGLEGQVSRKAQVEAGFLQGPFTEMTRRGQQLERRKNKECALGKAYRQSSWLFLLPRWHSGEESVC